MTKQQIRVVAAVIERDDRYVIAQRRPEGVLPLLWEFPGGKVEPGESDEDALKRELKERLDVDVIVGQQLSAMVHDYERYAVTLVIFRADIINGEPRPARVNDVRWVPSTELEHYEFPPADQATMDQLLGATIE